MSEIIKEQIQWKFQTQVLAKYLVKNYIKSIHPVSLMKSKLVFQKENHTVLRGNMAYFFFYILVIEKQGDSLNVFRLEPLPGNEKDRQPSNIQSSIWKCLQKK